MAPKKLGQLKTAVTMTVAAAATTLGSLLISLILASLVTSCGAPHKVSSPAGSPTQPSNFADGTANAGQAETGKTPPRDYYMGILERSLKDVDGKGKVTALVEAGKRTLFINFEGQNVAKGFAAGQSFLVCGAAANVPASTLDQSSKDAVVTQVEDYFTKAGVGVQVTDARPSSGVFTTVIVGGNFEMLGCPTVATKPMGVAPLDRGDMNPSDIAFVFSGSSDTKVVAAAVAHMAGHSFGLQNTDNNKDVMYPVAAAIIEGFGSGKTLGSGSVQDSPTQLQHTLALSVNDFSSLNGGNGAQVPGLVNLPDDLAKLPGLNNLSAMGKVIAGLKPSDVANINSLNTQIRAVLPASIAFPSLDKAVTSVALADKAAGGSGNGKTNVGGVSGVFQKVLSNPQALSTAGGAIAVIAVLSGAGGSAAAIGAILGAFGGGTGQTTGGTTPATQQPQQAPQLPDFAGLLGLTGIPDVAQLLGPYLNGHVAVVNGNFSGDVKTALISMLKVGYAQAFAAATGGTQAP